MRTRTRLAMGACFALLATPCSAQAEPPDASRAEPPSASSQEPAEEDLIAIGIHLRKEGRDAEALGTFERAYAQHRSPRAAAQIALAHHALAQWREAERGLLEALESSDDAWIARNRVYLEESLTVVQAHLAWLEVDSNVVGAEVWVGGEPYGRLPLAAPLRVVAGEVAVDVRAPGYAAIQREFQVPANSRVRVALTFVVEPGPEPRANAETPSMPSLPAGHPSSARRTAGWITLAGAGALVLVGIAGVVIREREAAIYNDDAQCGPAGEPRSVRCGTNHDIGSAALPIAVGAFVGAAIAGTVSGYLLLESSRPAAGQTARHVDCRVMGPGFACGGAF
jgi:hypothetical protein